MTKTLQRIADMQRRARQRRFIVNQPQCRLCTHSEYVAQKSNEEPFLRCLAGHTHYNESCAYEREPGIDG